MFARFMRTENRNGEGECYQVNGRIRAVYNDGAHQLTSLTFDGKLVEDNKLYTVGLIGYHIINSEPYFGVTQEDLLAAGKSKVIATNVTDVLEEYLKGHQNVDRKVKGRLVYT
jgi:5'-nucleotidase